MRNPVIHDLAQKLGGYTKIAKTVGRTKSAVCQWKEVPAHLVLQLEKASGISRHSIRPDVYGAKPQRKQAA